MTAPGFFKKRTKDSVKDDSSKHLPDEAEVQSPLEQNGCESDDRTDPLIKRSGELSQLNSKDGWEVIYESTAGRIQKPVDTKAASRPIWIAGKINEDQLALLKDRLQKIETPIVPIGEYTNVDGDFGVVFSEDVKKLDDFCSNRDMRPSEIFQSVFDMLNGLISLKTEAGLIPSSFDSSRMFVQPMPIGVDENGETWRIKFALLHEFIPIELNDLDDEIVRQALRTAITLLDKCTAPWYCEPVKRMKALFTGFLKRTDLLYASEILNELFNIIESVNGVVATNVGLVRKTNEDNGKVAIENTTRPGASLVQMWVADGMGGHAAGEIASHIAIATLERTLNDWRSSALAGDAVIKSHLERAFLRANANIFADCDLHSKRNGMGTTLTGLVAMTPYPPHTPGERSHPFVVIGRAWCANLGDSRTYLVGRSKLTRLSHDHSFVQQLLDNGSVTDDEAFTHPAKNVISKCLGADKTQSAQPDICSLFCGCGDLFLSASDGLTDLLKDSEIFQIIHDSFENSDALKKIANALIDAANDCGGKDNITVALVYFE